MKSLKSSGRRAPPGPPARLSLNSPASLRSIRLSRSSAAPGGAARGSTIRPARARGKGVSGVHRTGTNRRGLSPHLLYVLIGQKGPKPPALQGPRSKCLHDLEQGPACDAPLELDGTRHPNSLYACAAALFAARRPNVILRPTATPTRSSG